MSSDKSSRHLILDLRDINLRDVERATAQPTDTPNDIAQKISELVESINNALHTPTDTRPTLIP